MSKKQDSTNNKYIEEIEILKSQLARALADYDNFRKRTDREREQLNGIIKAQLFARLLAPVDMLFETQKHLQDAGLEMTIQEFLRSFKDEGIEVINAEKDSKFDEDLHEVVDTVEDNEKDDGEIVEEVAKGWKIVDGPVIRHAKVKVTKSSQVK